MVPLNIPTTITESNCSQSFGISHSLSIVNPRSTARISALSVEQQQLVTLLLPTIDVQKSALGVRLGTQKPKAQPLAPWNGSNVAHSLSSRFSGLQTEMQNP